MSVKFKVFEFPGLKKILNSKSNFKIKHISKFKNQINSLLKLSNFKFQISNSILCVEQVSSTCDHPDLVLCVEQVSSPQDRPLVVERALRGATLTFEVERLVVERALRGATLIRIR
ncbi:hypothetical protein MA16_Dca010001 [Dendrobium catenatum]|uniref:Uncharacterized protein n=1 Tax=Dendrobium catenatum TaxID=906689 RepID=A0A2I0VJ16_9ASPA|nr:hypothetical protein MA16_Dca010001 [Dendrobium catenatum]